MEHEIRTGSIQECPMGRGPWWHLPNETCIRIVRCMGASFSWFFPFYTPIFITISLFHCRSSDSKKKIDSPEWNGQEWRAPDNNNLNRIPSKCKSMKEVIRVFTLKPNLEKERIYFVESRCITPQLKFELKFHWQSNCILLEYPINSIGKKK